MAQPENGVSAEDVKKIARLSRLHVEDAACAPIAEDLNGILAWIEQLGEVDVEGVEGYAHVFGQEVAPISKAGEGWPKDGVSPLPQQIRDQPPAPPTVPSAVHENEGAR
jgi:aspartyl/glutamyl-tRNA(Asn/Gln) amidotransferase C subunit